MDLHTAYRYRIVLSLKQTIETWIETDEEWDSNSLPSGRIQKRVLNGAFLKYSCSSLVKVIVILWNFSHNLR